MSKKSKKTPEIIIWALLFISFLTPLTGQVILLDEDFNDCILPEDWNVDIVGNQDLVWYVDDFNHNPNSDSSSIDNTCLVAIDDDLSGNNTPAFTIRFSSPVFNGKVKRRLFVETDINFRVHAGNFMRVYINDGTSDHLLKEYNPSTGTGNQFSDFEHLEIEATAYASTTNTIIIEFEDTGSFGWYGAFDNVYVWSEGEGENLIFETFDDCALPTGWTTNIVTGEDDWQFGIPVNGQTMNGSCFAFFDDDAIGGDQPYSLVELQSPYFDGTQFKHIFVDFEVILRSVNEKEGINIILESNGQRTNLQSWFDGHGGPQFYDIEQETIELSIDKSDNMRLIFQYDDGDLYGWWTGIDNVFIYGYGAPTDVCEKALEVLINADCLADANTYSATDNIVTSCGLVDQSTLWYRYEAITSGKVHAQTNAKFNDLISVFEGTCDNITELACSNRDTYGFTGENAYFETEAGHTYYIRVAGIKEEFGLPKGDLCFALKSINTFPSIVSNDVCDQAVPLTLNAPCTLGHNINSTMTTQVPSQNRRAKADVWFSYLSGPSAQTVNIKSNSDFSESIILYEGTSCNNLIEIASNEKGKTLITPELLPSTQYFIQVTAFFATTEGGICLEVKPEETILLNDHCVEAQEIILGAPCSSSANIGSTYSGIKPSCIQDATSDVWYYFTAPASASIKLLPDMNFVSGLGIYSGQCDSLIEEACLLNPQKCDGYVLIDNLVPDQNYYVQILSTNDHFNISETGYICLTILDGTSTETYDPMQLTSDFNCTEYGIGTLDYAVQGGQAPYIIDGDANGSVIHTGDDYLVVATDSWGCAQSIQDSPDCGGAACTLAANIYADTINCITDSVLVWVDVQEGLAPYHFLWSTGDTTNQILVATNETDVSVQITDAQNCVSNLIPTFVIQTAVPIITLDQLTDAHGANNGSISITIDNPLYTVEWYLGIMFYSFQEDLTDLAPGEYSVVVTNIETGCVSGELYSIQMIVDNQNIGHKEEVQIVSNLTTEDVVIQYHFNAPENIKIQLYDMAGRLVLTKEATNIVEQKDLIDISSYASGVYQLFIYSDKHYWKEDIVVVK